MKKILIVAAFLTFRYVANAQVTSKTTQLSTASKDTTSGWKTGGFINVNVSQSQFYNWSAGGENAISLNGLVNLFADYKKGNSTWENQLDAAYGILNQGSADSWVKTDDKIELSSKYGQKATKNWYYAALLDFKTQMTAGYNYPNDSDKISDLLAPAYLIGAIGMNYNPGKVISLFIAPFTARFTYVNNQPLANAGDFGVDAAEYNDLGVMTKKGKKLRTEFGGYLKLNIKKDIVKNVNFQTQLELFSNYLHNPQNVDVDWDVLITMKINKYLSASIATELLYDDDVNITVLNSDGTVKAVGPRTQFREVFGLGLAYKF